MYQLFVSFLNSEESQDFDFDNGLICRWFNGQARISPRIISFYMDEENRELLSANVEYNVLPLMYDSAMVTEDTHTLMIQDTTIFHEIKNKLAASYPCRTDRDKSNYFSPLMRDFIFDVKVPRPCRYFCGQAAELEKQHDLLCSNGKVFVQGIAGVYKIELAKAYAKKQTKEYER